jgi:hypothetical protein
MVGTLKLSRAQTQRQRQKPGRYSTGQAARGGILYPAESRPLKQGTFTGSRNWPPSNVAVLLAVAEAILLFAAFLPFVAARPQATVTENESPPPLSDPDVGGNPQTVKVVRAAGAVEAAE